MVHDGITMMMDELQIRLLCNQNVFVRISIAGLASIVLVLLFYKNTKRNQRKSLFFCQYFLEQQSSGEAIALSHSRFSRVSGITQQRCQRAFTSDCTLEEIALLH